MAAQIFKKLFKSKRISGADSSATDNLPPISDSDFEFLFNQVMEGIAHGWHGERLVSFFQNLGKRGSAPFWIAWIDRYEAQILADKPNLLLGSRIIFLGEQLLPKLATRKLGERFFEMGQRIANPNAHLAKMDLIWEYDGPDVFQGTIIPPVATLERNVSVSLTPADSSGMADPWLSTEESIAPDANPLTVPTPPVTAPTPTAEMEQTEISPPTSGDNPPPAEELSVEEEPATNPPSNVEQLTLEQLRDRLEADPNFREQIAAQAGVNAGSDTESIIQALTKGINPATLDQDNYKHWFYFGVEKADQGHLEEAIAAWDKCLAIKPDLSSAWHNRGSALGHLNRLEEAISSFERAIEYNPEDFQAWNDKGIALFRQQKLEEAIYCWDKTLNLQPDFYQAWFNKGCLYENQGKYDEAKACYEQTLAIEPTFELASTRKQRLTELAPGETPSS